MSHANTFPSPPEEYSVVLEGSKARALTNPDWPSSVCDTVAFATSHSRILLSMVVIARVRPSGENPICKPEMPP